MMKTTHRRGKAKWRAGVVNTHNSQTITMTHCLNAGQSKKDAQKDNH